MDRDDLLVRLGMALAIGFLIGLERGWKDREEKEGQRTAGLRTYTLIALLGGIFGALSKDQNFLLLAFGFIVVSGALAAFFWREGVSEDDFSATSVVAVMLTFMLGAFAILGDPTVAAASEFIPRLKDVFQGGAVARPSSITSYLYNDVSIAYFTGLNQILTGQVEAQAAVDDMTSQIEDIISEL